MNAQPTGIRTAEGALELQRRFRAPADELWLYLVHSARLARWFGSWTGAAETGAVEVLLLAEENAPSERVEILHCDASTHQLAVRTGSGDTAWQLEMAVHSAGEGSVLVFRMPGIDPQQAGSVGPGWEYYLDRLAAAVSGADAAQVEFEPQYYPGMSQYYEQLFSGR